MSPRMRRFLRWCARYPLPVMLGLIVFSVGFNLVTARQNLEPQKATEDKGVEGSFVTGAGVRTHFVKVGKGETTILLLHGFGGSTWSWRKNINELAKDFTVFAIDIRGFGYTSRDPAAEYSPRGYATHVSTFMDILGIRRPVIVGHSLGGEVALRIALQRPDDVAGLVLIDSTGLKKGFGDAPEVPPPFNTTLVRLATSENVVRTALNSAFYNTAAVNREMIRAYRDPLDVESAESGLLRMARSSAPMLTTSEIGRISQPTLIIWGRQDTWLPVSQGEELSRIIKGSQLIAYERAGHMVIEERASDVNREIATFAGAVGKPLDGQSKPITPSPDGGPQPLPGSTPTPRSGAPTTSPSPGGYFPGAGTGGR